VIQTTSDKNDKNDKRQKTTSNNRQQEVDEMPVPLYEAKAEFFRMLGHPVRIRVLELLQDGPKPVRELLADIEVEPSNLSQQLAVLRRSGIVTATRTGSTVVYELAAEEVADLLAVARQVLSVLLTGQQQLLRELRTTEPTR
jgi:ArsR family transcriptional regulator